MAFLKRNATAYEQNVWHVISTNATVLVDNVKSRKEVEVDHKNVIHSKSKQLHCDMG